jgi:Fic family protein
VEYLPSRETARESFLGSVSLAFSQTRERTGVPILRKITQLINKINQQNLERVVLDVKSALAWHAYLFPTGRSGMRRIRVGAWREDSGDPMQVVSGPTGTERVRFKATAEKRLDPEMGIFIDWSNENTEVDWVERGRARAHLWFVTIHPFEDGNGRSRELIYR